MKRNLRFWTRFTWEGVEAELVVMGFFLLLNVFNSEPLWTRGTGGWMDFLALAPFYLIFAAALCTILIAPGTQMIYVPLLLSHGEPRKNVFWGFQYHRFLLIAATAGISGLVWALVPGKLSAACLSFLPLIVTGMVICSAVGGLFGSAYVKWKWLGVIIIAIVCGCGGGLAGWAGVSGSFDFMEFSVSIPGLAETNLPWQLAAAAAALLALDMGLQWLMLRRREVKL